MTINAAKIRLTWLVLVVVFYGLNLDQYFFSKGLGLAPKYWLLFFSILGVLLIPKFFLRKRMIGSPVAVWLLIYVVMSLLWLALSPYPDAANYGFSLVMTTLLMILIALMGFYGVPEATKIVTPLFLIILIGGICSVIWEMIDPAAFVNVGSGIIGRAAGFYLNPNSAALAFVTFFIVLLPRVSSGPAILIALGTLVGIALTFSRGALITWLLVVMFASWCKFLPRVSGVLILGLISTAFFASELILNYFQKVADVSWSNSLDRLRWILGEGSLTDAAAQSRRNVAQIGFNYFSESPIIGNGLGFTWIWAAEENTHNLILRHMVEYGLFGILIFPGLLFSIYKLAGKRVDTSWLVCGIIVIVVLSFFSHNMLEQGFFIIALIALTSPVKN